MTRNHGRRERSVPHLSTEHEIRIRIDRLADRLVANGVATEFVGCTREDIARVEADAGVAAPSAYVAFLERMGREAGEFYRGSEMFGPWLGRLTGSGRELVEEEESELRLPDDAVVFCMHQGYQFLFIRSGEGADPPVYWYLEDSGRFEKKADRLTDFLIEVADDEW